VLWQMVTGKRPYDTKTLSSFQLQSKIVNEPLDKTNSHWDELIQKATSKDMSSRFMSANAFKIALDGKKDKKVIESDATIIDSNVKQQPNPSPQKNHVNEPLKKEELPQTLAKKNDAPIIFILAFCVIVAAVFITMNVNNSSNYEDAYNAEADSIAAAKTADSIAASEAYADSISKSSTSSYSEPYSEPYSEYNANADSMAAAAAAYDSTYYSH
jgi:hypothetical protein